MTPTNKLRFVERKIFVPFQEYKYKDVVQPKKVRILQQWWAVECDGQVTPAGEWRDIPVEVEA
jgi:sulfur carrier protein ThiS